MEQQEIKNYAEEKHKSILTEKDKEMQELKQKYSQLENQCNELKAEYEYVGEYFDKQVNRAANTRVLKVTSEKDQEIQR